MHVRKFSLLAAAALALSPAVAMAQPLPPAPMPAPGDHEQVFTEQQTRSILDSLRVNGGTAAPLPVRDRPAMLSAGNIQDIALPVGGAQTVTVPGTFDRAIVVVPDVADVIVLSPGRIQVVARREGSTDLVLSSPSGQNYKAHITVTANASPVQNAVSAAMPGEHFTVTAVNGALMITGSTRDAVAATTALNIAKRFVTDPNNVVNNIQVLGAQQVMLKVRVAEVNRTVLKQLGLSTSLAQSPTGGGSGVSQVIGNDPLLNQYGTGSRIATGGGTSLNTTGGVQDLLALGAATNPVAFLSTKAFGSVFTTVASALESEGLVKTLAEPNLVTQSGKTASMLAGSQYPVPTISQSGRTGTEYHNFGVSLAFTPTVMTPTSINLEIATEVSTKAESVTFPDGAGGTFAVPVFNTRRANTTVELPSGGSIVIAGLVSTDMANTLSGVPGLKDIPILGQLFSSVAFTRDETELVISVTSYLVEPTDARSLGDPQQGMHPVNDVDLYLLARMLGRGTRPVAPPPQGVEHSFGYITE